MSQLREYVLKCSTFFKMLKTSLRLSENEFPAVLRFENEFFFFFFSEIENDVFTPNIDEQKTVRFRMFLT